MTTSQERQIVKTLLQHYIDLLDRFDAIRQAINATFDSDPIPDFYKLACQIVGIYPNVYFLNGDDPDELLFDAEKRKQIDIEAFIDSMYALKKQ